MIYFYTIRLAYWKNNEKFLVDYVVSFADIVDFLYEKHLKYSSMQIYWIKPYYKSYLY